MIAIETKYQQRYVFHYIKPFNALVTVSFYRKRRKIYLSFILASIVLVTLFN